MAARARWLTVAAVVAASTVTGARPVESTQPDVVIVGDSLTAGNLDLIRARLERGGLTSVRFEALSGRRIAVGVDISGYRPSGIEVVEALQAHNVSPDVWVIELGANDIGSIRNCGCADPVAFAGDLIDRMVAAVGPGERIAWVNLLDTSDLATSGHFNRALTQRAAVDPDMSLIDWYGLGLGRPELFLDHVHHTFAGVDVFAQMYLDEIGRLLVGGGAPPAGSPGPARRVSHDGFELGDVAR